MAGCLQVLLQRQELQDSTNQSRRGLHCRSLLVFWNSQHVGSRPEPNRHLQPSLLQPAARVHGGPRCVLAVHVQRGSGSYRYNTQAGNQLRVHPTSCTRSGGAGGFLHRRLCQVRKLFPFFFSSCLLLHDCFLKHNVKVHFFLWTLELELLLVKPAPIRCAGV